MTEENFCMSIILQIWHLLLYLSAPITRRREKVESYTANNYYYYLAQGAPALAPCNAQQ